MLITASDPFQDKHRADEKAQDASQRKSNQQAAAQQIQQRIAAKAAPKLPDVGYPWPKKFYDPK